MGDVNKLFVFKNLLTTPSNVLPLHLKQTFPPIVWIFIEGDGIESRLPFKIFSTLHKYLHREHFIWIKIKLLKKNSMKKNVYQTLYFFSEITPTHCLFKNSSWKLEKIVKTICSAFSWQLIFVFLIIRWV